MIEIKNKEQCNGCHACYNICPTKAISMQEDKNGFLYPKVNMQKCINCNLCIKVCPILNREEIKRNENKAYACINNNEDERLKSSSGGIFILLAKEIIKRNGVVFGACFDENYQVYHTYSESDKDLQKFMTSKYVQSKIGNAYQQVKKFLIANRYVLFTGTPCQIAGLKSFLCKDYDKLYTQDIICHGVPSPKVWARYLDYRNKLDGASPVQINFRQKDNGWSLFALVLSYNTSAYKQNHQGDLFMQAFLKNACLRESCYNCFFRKKNRYSDITLADYWGIQKIYPELNDEKGVSLVIVNSEKGMELLNSIKPLTRCVETDFEKSIQYNPAYLKSPNFNKKKRKKFFKELDNMDFDKLVKKYIPNKDSIYKKLVRKIKNKCKNIIKKEV